MPQVPYSPVPDVSASGAGTPGFDIQASPAAFGAGVGQAVQGLGQAAERGGDAAAAVAAQRQAVVNNVAVDAAFNQHQTAVNTILYGDPNDPSKPGYYSLRGQAALNARPGVLQALDDSRTGILNGLRNDVQRLGFDEASRRLNMYSAERVGAHADQEFSRYATETQAAAIDIKARDVANNFNDETNFQHNLADAGRAADAKSALSGADPNTPEGQALFANNRMQAAQTLYTARAVAIGNADPAAGLAFVQKNAGQFDAITLHRLTDEFKSGSDRAAVAGGISSVMATPVPGDTAPAAVSPDAMKSALRGQEGPGTSIQGAVEGLMPATFTKYARPGESFQNATDRAAVNGRVIDDLQAKFPGDPARVAVAYFSGPGNVAPAGSPTPWITDAKDGNGKSTSSYVADVMARLGPAGDAAAAGGVGQAPGHDPAPYGAEFARMRQAREQAAALFPNRPDLQRQMTDGVWQEIQQANVLQAKYEAEQAKQQRDAQAAAGQTFVKQILTDPKSVDTAALANDPSLTWEQKNDLFNVAQRRLREVAGGREAQDYGPGFWSAYQQVHADPADPNRIADPAQLWPRGGPNGDLSLAGIDRLTQEIAGTRTPEGAAEGQAKKAWFDAAHIAISGHGMMGGARDPVGEMNFAHFLAAALPELEHEKAAGMTLSQSLAKDAPLDKLMSQFKRSPADMMRDMLGASNPDLPGADSGAAGAPGSGKTAAADLTTPQGIAAAYKSGQFGYGPSAYDAAVAELRKRGFVKVPPPAAAAPGAPVR